MRQTRRLRRDARRRHAPPPLVDARRAVRLARGLLLTVFGTAALVAGAAGVIYKVRARRGSPVMLVAAAPLLLWDGARNLQTGFGPGERRGDGGEPDGLL